MGKLQKHKREPSGSVVECLTRDLARGRGLEPHQHHYVVSLSKNINPSFVLVQPRKTLPFITERLLMGRKESNKQTKAQENITHKRAKRSALFPTGDHKAAINRHHRRQSNTKNKKRSTREAPPWNGL